MREIRWVELPGNVDALPPREQMEAFRRAAEQRPPDAPWIGMIVPLAPDGGYREVNVSLVGSLRFAESVLDAFSALAQAMVNALSADETSWIGSDQLRRGNAPELWSRDDGLLRMIVPSRLEASARQQVEKMLSEWPDPVVETFEE